MTKFMNKKELTEVTIILPAYNEAISIGLTVSTIKKRYPNYEVLVVDDGSTDQTKEMAISAGAKVYSHPYNMGNGAAIKSGLRNAAGEWVAMMDADGQHAVEDIERLLEQKSRFDMVVGARSKSSEGSMHRNLANWVYNKLATYVTKFHVQDLTSGFRLAKRDVARKFIYLLPNGFSYPTTITMAYLRSGYSIKYVPIRATKRKGKSKISIMKDGTRFLLIIARIATLYSPFRVFLPISLGLFFTGCLYYIYTLIFFSRFTNMSALLFSTSVIIFMIGLVSEQISQMRYEKID